LGPYIEQEQVCLTKSTSRHTGIVEINNAGGRGRLGVSHG
jgi:hypothetical protein